ncbi:MAG: PQQ-binding-like beta-propeller repeat protein [Planctomycetota bacterium]|nr:PQQ-binding-like beta-propeller repeat protein [Planctomycetota bacterium]
MTDPATQTSSGDAMARARYQAAVGAAAVAGLFLIFVCAFLASAHVRSGTLEFQKSEELAGLRAAILKAPDAATAAGLREAVRRRDLELRENLFGGWPFLQTGGYLLLGGAVVFVIAAGQAFACRRRLPMPALDAEAARKAAASRRRGRAAVVALAVLIGGAGVLVGVFSVGGPAGQPPPAAGGPGETAGGAPPAAADFPSAEEIARQWPRFRGPAGLGVSAYANVPPAWNGAGGEGILWKTPVPLAGENSPVVWGDRVFLTGATDQKREVYCFDAATGNLLWQKPVQTPEGAALEPPEVLEDTGFAAPTAATDGRRTAAIFANGDIACFDYAGRQLWARNLGTIKNSYGYSSSLHLYRGRVLVLLDQGTPAKPLSSLLALDGATGKTAWETKRPVPASWATPILIHTGKREEFIAAAKPWVISYDPAGGTELWRAKVLDGDVAPSPTFGAGLVFAVNSGAKLAAIRPDGQGDVTESAIAWAAEDGLPDIVSPLTDGKLVWLFTTDGTLTCYRVKDGTKAYEKEMDVVVKSSPTLAGDRIYVTDEKGVTYILATGETFQELGKVPLGEAVRATPAFLDGRIYIRGVKHLYAIGKK